ncbi:Dyp-type peroxidase [Micropruina glycogenica]|uniref:Glutathione peroxidase family protein n=1 Tax=Micropruina glycogenica TaxID=75385 RepID=A0A2N9JK09_9ACTN|nr:Dyp-type peroxidase [Micropruina glycogenica]SPD87901.1 Glutathione peroxidase family protein [Micropruina glycogenica]
MTTSGDSDTPAPTTSVSRRGLLAAGGAVAATSVGVAAGYALAGQPTEPAAAPEADDSLVPFHGPHQAGIATQPQTHAAFLAFDLRGATDRAAAVRLMKLLTDDARRLTAATPVLGDQEPELARTPARLTFTFGFGPRFFTQLGLMQRQPSGLTELPAFGIDQLKPQFCDGDLLVQVCADDPLVLAHAVRQVTKTTRSFAKPRWVQRGFTQPRVALHGAEVSRNLMGQLDGTVNPVPATPDFDAVVWAGPQTGWFAGGTTLVLRRITMQLDTWDELDTPDKELTIGRRLASGAPLTGTAATDQADFAAVDANGLPVIPPFSHMARARPHQQNDRFLRRPYNYDDSNVESGADAGLLFVTYQADIAAQYLPVQQRLAEQDLLNAWTVPIGSAVFALPPGCDENGYIGEGLLA